jgi:hypothetical protein
MEIPSLIGFRPEEAEETADALGLTLIWLEAPKPNLLPPQNEPRVGRQRLLEDGTLELLKVFVPVIE